MIVFVLELIDFVFDSCKSGSTLELVPILSYFMSDLLMIVFNYLIHSSTFIIEESDLGILEVTI